MLPIKTLSALGDLPAGEGFSAILGAALNGLLALALIFAVLIVMDRVRKKKETEKPPNEPNGTPSQKEKDETGKKEETRDKEE
ncbi:MAG: hypothetical protein NC084_02845 [Bacteroides sp.]|nr:hypothetical protein [Eubacterium sp.]MCM1417453.1 hypothetical protein [Roseburia sp.]MCM1461633.1 hypothetical protein [Bacteroides sp.]